MLRTSLSLLILLEAAARIFPGAAFAQSQRGLIWGQSTLEAITFPAGIVRGIRSESRSRKYRAALNSARTDEGTTKNLFGDLAFWNKILEVQETDGSIQKIVVEDEIDPNHIFAFRNEADDFSDVRKRTVGYCWGYSSLLRRFKYLANFDSSQPRLDEKELKSRIADILDYKKTTFPGFNHVRELSEDPVAARLLKFAVIRAWEKEAIRLQSFVTYNRAHRLGRKGFDSKDAKDFIAKLDSRIEAGASPLIMLFHKELKRYVHVVPVYELRKYQDKETNQVHYRACFIDNHGTAAEHNDCGKYFLISDQGRLELPEWNRIENDDGKVLYQNFRPEEGNLGWVDFTPDDEAESWLLLKASS
ncbi:MAG: hypothetical protein JNL01_07030 [Bdellovibrionales bacterium]|nr:hypothetical protein [Bdellovibrionales bacterium]